VNTRPIQRPIGFTPSEISARVVESVISQHAEETAFLWTMRNRAVTEPHYSLADLAKLDERVDAHRDGLEVAASAGWTMCKASMAITPGPGEAFALGVLAFSSGDRDRMSEALHAGCASPLTRSGLVSALGWLSYPRVSPWIARLLAAKAAVHRSVAVAAGAIHREDIGDALVRALEDADPVLRARALRMVGEIKRGDVASIIRASIRDSDEACAFWAAWSMTVLGEPGGVQSLARWLERETPFSRRALQLSLRAMPLEDSRKRISAMAQDDLGQLAVLGAGVVGDPTAVPWLIRKMEAPELARLAGEAFSLISGADLGLLHLDQDPHKGQDGDGQEIEQEIEEVLELDYESNLPCPSPTLVAAWWEAHKSSFSFGTRYLGGRPITRASLNDLLARGKQRVRAAAALELALLDPSRPLFEVRAPARRQQRLLPQWTS
jgi:uncharacterized protein (TIGR02270 family)